MGQYNKEIEEKILKAIYWKQFSRNQSKVIAEIINSELDKTGKAGEICDFLGIERRGNRSAIKDLLD